MSVLLIVGVPKDFHAQAVIWGLRRFGVETRLWIAGDLPDYATLTVALDGATMEVTARHGGAAMRLDDVSLIWNRRLHRPQAPAFAAAVDRSFVEDQCFEHAIGVRHLICRKVRTVNHPSAQALAARKAVQLAHAQDSGLVTPATLISNDFDAIRAFRAAHAPIVVKPFRPTVWTKQGDMFAAFTALMPEPTEEMRPELELCPQIFQACIENKRDVRAIAFGGQCFAAEILPNADRGDVDVRDAIRSSAVVYRPIEVPPAVLQGIERYLGGLGLDFGAFDFAIDGDGVWHFLECNESGQFLFIEMALPELRILDAFCRWLCGLMGVAGLPEEPLDLRAFSEGAEWLDLRSGEDGHKHFIMEQNAYRREDAVPA